jgi:hypothetical protein
VIPDGLSLFSHHSYSLLCSTDYSHSEYQVEKGLNLPSFPPPLTTVFRQFWANKQDCFKKQKQYKVHHHIHILYIFQWCMLIMFLLSIYQHISRNYIFPQYSFKTIYALKGI